jgi:hypothetical protein
VLDLPGGVTPAYGQKSLSEGEWRFDFHGFLTAPLNAGFNKRRNPPPGPGQSETVLHAPPVVPDDLETFSHTGVVPTTYAQLNFSEGNSIVTGNVSVVAKQANASTSFLEPASQLGITDVFISVLPPISSRVHLQGEFGAFTLRYGATGEYDEGRYGTPLIARVQGVGEEISAKLRVGNLVLMAEQGLKGQTNKAGAAVTPTCGTTSRTRTEGTSFAAHGHLGVQAYGRATLGLHYVHAWSQDDRGNNVVTGMMTADASQPDAKLDVVAADLRIAGGRFGHLYGAASYTNAKYVTTLSRIISILNTKAGPA